MKGDFSRLTFDSKKDYTGVLMQQGRVLLDADWNEQGAIQLEQVRELAKSVIGWHGTPAVDIPPATGGFKPVGLYASGLKMKSGHYFVNGIRCTLLGKTPSAQYEEVEVPLNLPTPTGSSEYLVYLDVWERDVHPFEDRDSMEVALNGIDTAGRRQTQWAVRLCKLRDLPTNGNDRDAVTRIEEIRLGEDCLKQLLNESPENRDRSKPSDGKLLAQFVGTDDPSRNKSPCEANDQARSEFGENQLYRIEIHTGGKPLVDNTAPLIQKADKSDQLANGSATPESQPARTATFKWSRDNGSVVVPIKPPQLAAATVEVDPIGVRGFDRLAKDDRVEAVNSDYYQQPEPNSLLRIVDLDPSTYTIKLHAAQALSLKPNPILRRWDHKGPQPVTANGETDYEEVARVARTSGRVCLDTDNEAAVVVAGNRGDIWLKLENGLEIKFDPQAEYRAGDYWLIPIRATKPLPSAPPAESAVPPHGTRHHYAPLCKLTYRASGDSGWSLDHGSLYWKPFAPFGVPVRACKLAKSKAETEADAKAADRGDASTENSVPGSEAPAAPAPPAPENPAPEPAPASDEQSSSWASDLIAPEYHDTLRSLFVSTRDVARQIPARFLRCEPESGALRRWLGSALVSEITGLDCDQFLQRVNSLAIDEQDHDSLQRDARTVWLLAKQLEKSIEAAPHWKLKYEAVA